MNGRVDEDDLRLVFRTSPLLTEATKLIVESDDGISVSDIARRLHKKPPTVHRALGRLQTLSLVSLTRKGRTVVYQILPTKKDVVKRILSHVYYPTKSFVIGELARPPPNVRVTENAKVVGVSFGHTIDILYEYSGSGRKEPTKVALDVMSSLTMEDTLYQIGKFLDAGEGLDGYVLVVVEDGPSRESFSFLERFLNGMVDHMIPVTAVFVERKDPLKGIKQARDVAVENLREMRAFKRAALREVARRKQ